MLVLVFLTMVSACSCWFCCDDLVLVDILIVDLPGGANVGTLLNVNTDGTTSFFVESQSTLILESSPTNAFTHFGLLGIVLKAPPGMGKSGCYYKVQNKNVIFFSCQTHLSVEMAKCQSDSLDY